MWWGHSIALDLQSEIINGETKETLQILIIGDADARHIIKTWASCYNHLEKNIIFHVVQPSLYQVARAMLLLSTCLDKNLGLQEATRYYLELMGNTLIRPATAKYLMKRIKQLILIVTKTVECSWLNLQSFKFKEIDDLEVILKMWEYAICMGLPIQNYWDCHIRKLLTTRYDYREGIFDWDYHMILKSRKVSNLSLQEYRFWRNCGIAFTWLEGEPARINPTFLNNTLPYEKKVCYDISYGDFLNGPFYTWSFSNTKYESHRNLRATDVAEQEVMRSIYEMHNKQPLPIDFIAAHRESTSINGIIVSDIPHNEVEQEKWVADDKKLDKNNIFWINNSNIQISYHSLKSFKQWHTTDKFYEKFDAAWISQDMINEIPIISSMLKKEAVLLVELRKFFVQMREEDLVKFIDEVKIMTKTDFSIIDSIEPKEHCVARFYKH